MGQPPDAPALLVADLPTPRQEQFRMRRLQVFNWGTFSGLHDIPIAERGFLIVGRSGSGKSTLLDAISALLVPPAIIDFNAAARENERSGRDRSLVSYVRGAWADQHDEDSGEVATQYLRRGPTWSALALEYRNALGRTVSLVRILWIRGNGSAAADLRKHYLIAERPFDLATELDGFDLDVRRLKQRVTDAHHHDRFAAYAERFRHLLGIGNEAALRLLHKTQSAKNLGDLNRFLRDFMLEKPETFKVAERLVAEFAELDQAHRAVVAAREQIETLRPARDAHRHLSEARAEHARLGGLVAGIDGWRERHRLALLDARTAVLETADRGLAAEEAERTAKLGQCRQDLDGLRARHREQGGAEIERLQHQRAGVEAERDSRLRHRGLAAGACRELEWPLAESAQAFAEAASRARGILDAAQTEAADAERRVLDAGLAKSDAERAFAAARTEIAALEAHPSNVPAQLQDLRQRLCAAVGLADSALPFAGELIQVRADAAAWTGAIERLLHGFALSLLVDERHYAKVSAWVDQTDLRGKLVYHRVGEVDAIASRPPRPEALLRKVELAAHAHRVWLEAELQRRYDYACVDSIAALRRAERGLTRQGQIKHGRSRHEKDDRFALDDRRRWVLGFDNRAKLALYKREAQQQAERIAAADAALDAVRAEQARRQMQAAAAQTLANLSWTDVDVASVLARLDAIDQALAELRSGNAALGDLEQRIARAVDRQEDAERGLIEVRTRRAGNRKDLAGVVAERARCAEAVAILPLTDDQRTGLEALAPEHAFTLENLAERVLAVERGLRNQRSALEAESTQHEHAITAAFEDYRRAWPELAGDVQADLASAPDFFHRLERLERDGLPAHESRFFELLRTQSGQNLVALQTHITQAHKAIRARMEDVNASLALARFNRDSILRIKPEDRRLPEVIEFRAHLREVLGQQRQTDDRERAEAQFVELRKLVMRLASSATDDARWREQVLDVRLHLEFIGEEIAISDGHQIEVYRSGAGKSGGQRQKLATTCLAAALRYQLGDEDGDVPQYAAVVLDEAFDKADDEFTTMAMRIFENFGFQMIVATPLKSVMTLEPFIGGACFVAIEQRNRSSVLMIEYDAATQRLDLPHAVREPADAEP